MVIQKGMWAMIATCIALVIWTSGLLFMTVKAENKRFVEERGNVVEEKSFEAGLSGENKA